MNRLLSSIRKLLAERGAASRPEDGTGRSRPLRSFLVEFLRTEASGGALLLASAVAALWWANSSFSNVYESIWTATPGVGSARWPSFDLRHLINDGLMTLFFFVVGLEIKRELTQGELRNPRLAALPIAGALGGMAIPAAVFLAVTRGGPGVRGWPIPMATDIAFAIGVASVLGKLVPLGIKLFILALAIADDIGAVAVIAVSRPDEINVTWLAGSVVVASVAIALRGLWVGSGLTIALAAALTWLVFQQSGVHPTLAGVAVALMIPTTSKAGGIAHRLEQTLHPWTSLVILPLFALANAGVSLTAAPFSSAGSSVTLGVVLGLVLGKTLGIFSASWLALRLGFARMPEGLRHLQLLGAAAICGIGFTVSLFMASLLLEGPLLESAKVGILIGSAMSAVAGSILLWFASKSTGRGQLDKAR